MRNFLDVDWTTLPRPEDDGGADHLLGHRLSSLALAATSGEQVDLSALSGLSVVYIYPRTGRPDEDLPEGWDAIPGARGCTPQSCAFRDRHDELRASGVAQVFGLSTQDTAYQCEVMQRLHLPFPLLSDARLTFTRALRLPTFQTSGMTLLKRMTLLIRDAVIVHVFYPVFPPDADAGNVLAYLGRDPADG